MQGEAARNNHGHNDPSNLATWKKVPWELVSLETPSIEEVEISVKRKGMMPLK